jgi:hypothetical protein
MAAVLRGYTLLRVLRCAAMAVFHGNCGVRAAVFRVAAARGCNWLR